MRCTVLRSFNFSRTGVDQNWASRGTEHDIPDDLVPGLVAEGYVRPMGQKMVTSPERKVIEASPENQAMRTAPQNKRSVGKGPKGLWFVMQDGARVSRGFNSAEAAQAAIYDA
jgi:hypothetical protein